MKAAHPAASHCESRVSLRSRDWHRRGSLSGASSLNLGTISSRCFWGHGNARTVI